MRKIVVGCGREKVVSDFVFDLMGDFEICHACPKVNECEWALKRFGK